MTEVADKIVHSAEKLIRKGGFNGFSYADISKDVGLAKPTIHHYFRTKEELTVEVVRRYVAHVSQNFDDELAKGGDVVETWVRLFRGTITKRDEVICPCIVLGAAMQNLSPEVAVEVQKSFKMHIEKMKAAGLSEERATEVFTTLTGAQYMALIFNDVAIYDTATKHLLPKKLDA